MKTRSSPLLVALGAAVRCGVLSLLVLLLGCGGHQVVDARVENRAPDPFNLSLSPKMDHTVYDAGTFTELATELQLMAVFHALEELPAGAVVLARNGEEVERIALTDPRVHSDRSQSTLSVSVARKDFDKKTARASGGQIVFRDRQSGETVQGYIAAYDEAERQMEARRLQQNAEKNALAKKLLGGLKALVDVHGGPWSADEHPVPGADTPLVMPDR